MSSSNAPPGARGGPLAGIRVLDVTTTFSGPYCTVMLAELGADVIKIEAPGGDVSRHLGVSRDEGMASVFVAVNRAKSSVMLDLRSGEGSDTMRKLIGRADCLVHNMRPAASARLGIDAKTALGLNPRLIHAMITGYGSDGPYAGRPAYDDIIQADSGLAWLQGLAGEASYVASAVADKVAGLAALNAVTTALYWRERTGQGQAVEIPMFEMMATFALMEQWGGRAFVPSEGPTGYPRMRSPFRRPYRTADGLISLVVYHGGHWQRFLKLAGRADLLEDERYRTQEARNRNVDDLYALLETLMRDRTTGQWLEALAEIDIPATSVKSLDDLFDDEHLAAVGLFHAVVDEGQASYLASRSPLRFSASPVPDPGELLAPQRLGGGTAAVHRWLDAPDAQEGPAHA